LPLAFHTYPSLLVGMGAVASIIQKVEKNF